MTTTATMAPGAVVYPRTYVSGRRFYIVECPTCHVVCNSGHHYTDIDQAVDTAERHNEERGH